MTLSRLIGCRMVVDYPLLNRFEVEVAPGPGGVELIASGTIMESAKVFEELQVEVQGHTILVTIYAALVIWKSNGSPDFRATQAIHVTPGEYELRYRGSNTAITALKRVTI